MPARDNLNAARRAWLRAAAAIAAALPLGGRAADASAAKPRVGIIGTGKIGGALAALWAKAGYELVISSRHPEQLQALAKSLGPKVRAATPREAAAFGEVVLVSVPYGALPQVGRDYAAELKGKIVLDTGNPYPHRDGAMAEEARRKGTGVASAEFLPGVRLVRAFNSIPAYALPTEAHRAGERIGVPLAADDPEALKVAARLVQDAGFEPVIVGPLSRAKEFDVGAGVYGRAITARELRQGLNLKP